MKIYYLSKSLLPSRTANSVHVTKMSQAFANNGHEIKLFGFKREDKNIDIFDFYGVKKNFDLKLINRTFNNALSAPFDSYKVKKIIKSDSLPDLLYGRDLLSLFVLTNNDIPIIYEAHSPPSNKIKYFVNYLLFKSDEFKSLVVISKALKKEYLKLFPFLTKNDVIVAPDGADIPKYHKKNDHEINYNIGYVGSLYEGRGINVIIECAKRLPKYSFHIFGGNNENIKFWEEKTSNISNLVFHGFVPNSKLDQYYNIMDILLAPYQKKVTVKGNREDTSKWMSPMKIFEYMSYNKPIISSNISVLKEILKHKYNSLLVEPNNIDEWVSSINLLYSNKKLFKKISENAYYDLKTKYTWSTRAKKIIDNFRR